MGTATITEWDLAARQPADGGVELVVDFDPKSLQLTYNPTGTIGTAAPTESGTFSKAPSQQTGQSATLSVDLTFDTSTTARSVLEKTGPLVALTEPRKSGEAVAARRVVRFHWGDFRFVGTVQSMSQTIDFFSADGVPLRAAVHLSLSEMKEPDPDGSPSRGTTPSSFGANAAFSASASFGGSPGTTPLTLSQSGDTVQSIAARAGSGVSWKAVAAANGVDNPRLLPPGTVLNARVSRN